MKEKELFLSCNCGDGRHLLSLTCFKDELYDEIYLSILGTRTTNIFVKIWECLKYIFKGSDLYYTETILTKKDAQRLSDSINQHLTER